MARVYTGERVFLPPSSARSSAASTASCASTRRAARTGRRYARSVLVCRACSGSLLYLILRTQTLHPFNPQGFHSGTWDVTFNTAVVVRHQHELAVLRRRDDDDLLQPDGRADGAELRLRGRRHLRRRRPDPRHRRARAARSLGNFWQDLVRTLLYVLLPISVVGALLLVSQGVIQTLALARAAASRSRSARSPRRRSSRSSAPTAAASSTPTRRSVREPVVALELRRDAADPADPGGADRDLRADGRQPPAGLGDLLGDGDPVRHRRRRRLRRRAARRRRRSTPAGDRTARQPGGQGAALRDRQLRRSGPRHHGHVVRRGQRRLRVADRPRRGGPVREPHDGRGRLRRRRHRPVLDAGVRPARRLHRRPDGRPHAGVPRQEDRRARDQAAHARHAVHAAHRADDQRAAIATQAGASRSPPPVRRASPRTSTPTSPRATTTARRGPATPATSSPSRQRGRTASRSPTCSAG